MSNRKEKIGSEMKVMVSSGSGVKLIEWIHVVCDKRVKTDSLSSVGCQK